MAKLGVLFNIEELGGGAYGYSAYRILLRILGRNLLFESLLSDGDVGPNWEYYCIAIELNDISRLHQIKSTLFRSNTKGLAKRQFRFLDGPSLDNAPLVIAGFVDSYGQLHNCETWFVTKAWEGSETAPDRTDISENDSAITESNIHVVQHEPKIDPGEHSPGEIFGKKYLILDVCKGGMGLVYIAEDLESLKDNIILRMAFKTFQARYLWDTNAIQRFEREALNWVRLGKHPNLVHAMVVQQIEAKPYIWLEFVDGMSLAEHLSQKRMGVKEVLDVALQFCSGIRYAYENHGLLHRDVKPGNIMISHDGVVKITDFGLSKIQAEFAEAHSRRSGVPFGPDETLTLSNQYATGAGVCVGTPAYLAPEAILDQPGVDIRADIYSFGIVLFEMLTGQRPFHGHQIFQQHVRVVPPPVRSLNPDLTPQFEEIVNRCLMKDPAHRYASFAKLEEALLEITGDQPKKVSVGIPPIDEKNRQLLQGFSFMELGKYQEAIRWFEEVIKIDAKDAEAYNNIGVCLGNLKNFEEAAVHIEKAVTIRPDYPEAWANLGSVYYRLKRFEEGIRTCNRAILLRPDWAEAQSNKGINLLALDQLEEAMSCFESAMRMDPKYWKAYAQAGEAQARSGNTRKAIEYFNKALAIAPREAYLLALAAACLHDLGQTEEAKALLGKAQEVDAQDSMVIQVSRLLK
ncbi:serine/threonine-protein kinase [bacterium]|nr:serine/threonine-protein kinase [bacterium]